MQADLLGVITERGSIMEIIKTGQNGVMILLNSSDYGMIVSPDGQIDAVTARNIALRALSHTGTDCSDSEFLLDAFFGRDSCLLFASKQQTDAPVLYKFRSLKDACACARAIPMQAESALYYYKKHFFLLFSECGAALSRILSEYGQPSAEISAA